MYLKLKENYIIHQSPLMPMLIDTEEQTHATLTKVECALMDFLDGTYTYDSILNRICTILQINKNDYNKVKYSLDSFLYKFRNVITYEDQSNNRCKIVYGSEDYIVPSELSVELTNKCLLECIHCYKDAGPCKSTFVDYDNLLNFLKQLTGKVYSVQLTGGEAMLHPHFFEILEYCKKNFKYVSVSTTGLMINKHNASLFRNTHVYLSLYSFDSACNEEYTGSNVLSKVIDAAYLLVEKGVHVCINTIANDQNIQTISEFIDKCEKIGVNGVGIGKVAKVGRGKFLDGCEFCSEKCEKRIADIESTFKSNTMYLSTFIGSNMPDTLRCGLYKWIVNEDGDVLPCAFFPSKMFAIGQITDPILSIFTKEKYCQMKNSLKIWSEILNNEGIHIEEICPTLSLVNVE